VNARTVPKAKTVAPLGFSEILIRREFEISCPFTQVNTKTDAILKQKAIVRLTFSDILIGSEFER
jgi:hypothetical protein